MDLQTYVQIDSSPFSLNHNDVILSLGSCFSDSIAKKLKDFKFNIITNPFGVLYNPISISNSLRRIISGHIYDETDIEVAENIYFSFDHHSSFNSFSQQKILDDLNQSLSSSNKQWQNLSTLIITFGTSFVYELKDNKRIVSNCHKLPSSLFNRRLLTPDEIIKEYTNLLNNIYKINSQIKIIITISPIRHLRDSAHENQISKSHLFTSINEICKLNQNIYYFPSYEIMMDELRDYRFYKEDMVHPSKLAEEYILEKFKNKILDESTQRFIKRYDSIAKAKKHNLMTDNQNSIDKFKNSMTHKIEILQNEFPNIDLSTDLDFFKTSF